MRVTIDTQNDSQEDIRKAIKLLMSIVGDGPIYSNEEPRQEADFGDAMSMFDTPIQPQEDKEDKDPQVQLY